MASIKGVKIKNLVRFNGHEYEPLIQGDLYLFGKKIGWYSEDFCGGEYHFIPAERSETERTILKLIEEYKDWYNSSDYPFIKYQGLEKYINLSDLVTDLVLLIDIEKQFIKEKKRGYNGIVEKRSNQYIKSYPIKKEQEKEIKCVKNETIGCFFALSDFII